ncbi:hypothetical protein CIPAW_09G129700 [Carya illinoinensis]|uniref:Uncharacterized protein n=1 Tax=Carya illinoinensis TaxID=32201 RepID=A0A8T1PMI2_CARIL|nr:hypothetical protein CIPAW_09G129700 [Carya illinoinensis]KAG6642253.1 hypothetical protein CIPAW_09G129700 [Carya illinoinensis]
MERTTNASFVLCKYYFSLLHHYEQIYFFKARGWVPISSANTRNPSSSAPAAKDKYCRIGWRSIMDAEGILYAWTFLRRLGVLYAAAWFFLHGF